MKLVLAIVSNDDTGAVVPELIKEGYSVTTLSTTGGFLRVGNTTLLVVTEDEKVTQLRNLFAKYCSSRKKVNPSTSSFGKNMLSDSPAEEVSVGGATFFVLNVDKMEKF